MYNYIYILFNNLSNRYESVMSFASDSMALHRLGNSSIDTKEFSLCRVGRYNLETGVVESEPPVRLVWENNEKSN